MILRDFFTEAANPAQQAAIAIAMKKAHKKPKTEGKVKLSTDPKYYGATIDDTGFDSLPVVDIPTNELVGFEPDDKMNQPKSKANVKKMIAGLKRGDKLPPLLVREYENGYQVLDGHHRFWAYKSLGIKSIPAKVVPAEDIEEIGKQGVAEAAEQQYLWHGSRQKIPMLEPRQAVDTGGAAGSNQNAIYATSDPTFATQMGMPAAGSDYGHFPNDPQMVLFSGKIRKGENVYLHKLPFYGPDGKPQFVQGAHDREFHSVPGVKGIKPVEIKAVPVDRYLNLIRQATPADWELRKQNMKEGMAEACWKGYHKEGNKKMFGKTYPNCVKNTNEAEQCPECGGPMFSELMINEKQDACYYKVKSRYKVWPSAYASGALVQCRKKGAANWGNKSKK